MTLLFVWGPPAVGKMAVGRAIAESSDFRLFHNHATIEPLLDVFDYGTPAFLRLNGEMRHRILEEAAAADVNLVQTYAWALDGASFRTGTVALEAWEGESLPRRSS